ncbi:MAG: carbohydrate kinase family protein [Lachnospiraceae bacterium]|nr:carbohydrate kinase family protein [Lachnospiraceae bacterium]
MKKYDIICIGTALVDSIITGFDPTPVSASGYLAKSQSLKAGGEAVNVSIALAKLGLKTGIVCSLGADPAGDMIAASLKENGVDTDLLIRSGDHPTPVTTMFVKDDGSRKSIVNEAHRYNFHPEQNKRSFTDARALILGSLFRAPFDDAAIIREVLKSAGAAGQVVFADTKLPNYRILELGDVKDSLEFIDYITPNEDEARYFTGRDDPEEMAEVFLDQGVRNVIIKLGAGGCLLKNAEGSLRLSAYKVDAIDSTGAGDNFIAGFASELLHGASAHEALKFANACGAICTTAVGAQTALKNRDQVLEFMACNV